MIHNGQPSVDQSVTLLHRSTGGRRGMSELPESELVW